MAELQAIKRPDGRFYRPRKINCYAWENDDQGYSGVVVFGTHDVEHARALALSSARLWYGTEYVTRPVQVWWHDAMEGGERRWRWDAERGRAGISFTASDDPEEIDD